MTGSRPAPERTTGQLLSNQLVGHRGTETAQRVDLHATDPTPHGTTVEVPTLLFVCEHNAGRSQLAAGLAADRAGVRVRVLSAGTNPDARVDAVMLASLAELGIDRSDQVPTLLTDDLVGQADVIVAVKPDLGIVPADGAQLQTWTLPEPERWDVEGLRPLRDFLDQKVQRLLDDVVRRPS